MTLVFWASYSVCLLIRLLDLLLRLSEWCLREGRALAAAARVSAAAAALREGAAEGIALTLRAAASLSLFAAFAWRYIVFRERDEGDNSREPLIRCLLRLRERIPLARDQPMPSSPHR